MKIYQKHITASIWLAIAAAFIYLTALAIVA